MLAEVRRRRHALRPAGRVVPPRVRVLDIRIADDQRNIVPPHFDQPMLQRHAIQKQQAAFNAEHTDENWSKIPDGTPTYSFSAFWQSRASGIGPRSTGNNCFRK